MAPLVELLDRQVHFLLRQRGSGAFLVQIEPFLSTLRSEPRLAAYLDDMLHEVVAIIEAMEAADAELTSELVSLRRDLVAISPRADDSATEPPPGSGATAEHMQARLSFWGTLAYFDIWAASDPEPFNVDGDGGLAKTLLGILQNKDVAHRRTVEQARAEAETPTPDPLAAWRRRLGDVQARYDYAVRLMRLRCQTSAGLALARLEAAADELNPPPPDPNDANAEADTDAVAPDTALFTLAWRQIGNAGESSVLDDRVTALRDAVERLHEDLRRRIGATRSRVALVNRFKLRCEWHDRERMCAVADDQRLAGTPEDRLTRELARYLFDAGLSPLTQPLATELQPELLDPRASFYVGATQYTADSGRSDLITGVAQVLDAVGRLHSGPYAVDEAFCLVFRRTGPVYDLPAVLATDAGQVHLVLVDLGPAPEAAQAQRDAAVAITPDELLARVRASG